METPGSDRQPELRRLDYRERVLRAFIRDGRLTVIPSQEKKRLVILEFLCSACFAEDRDFPEAEVNERLRSYHEDVAALRRYMVVAGLLTRSAGTYRRVDRPRGTEAS